MSSSAGGGGDGPPQGETAGSKGGPRISTSTLKPSPALRPSPRMPPPSSAPSTSSIKSSGAASPMAASRLKSPSTAPGPGTSPVASPSSSRTRAVPPSAPPSAKSTLGSTTGAPADSESTRGKISSATAARQRASALRPSTTTSTGSTSTAAATTTTTTGSSTAPPAPSVPPTASRSALPKPGTTSSTLASRKAARESKLEQLGTRTAAVSLLPPSTPPTGTPAPPPPPVVAPPPPPPSDAPPSPKRSSATPRSPVSPSPLTFSLLDPPAPSSSAPLPPPAPAASSPKVRSSKSPRAPPPTTSLSLSLDITSMVGPSETISASSDSLTPVLQPTASQPSFLEKEKKDSPLTLPPPATSSIISDKVADKVVVREEAAAPEQAIKKPVVESKAMVDVVLDKPVAKPPVSPPPPPLQQQEPAPPAGAVDEGLGGEILGYRRLEIGTTEHLIQWDEGLVEWIDTEALSLEFPSEVSAFTDKRRAGGGGEAATAIVGQTNDKLIRTARNLGMVAIRILATARAIIACGCGLTDEADSVRGCVEDFTFHGRDWRDSDVLVYALDNLQALLARREAPGLLDKAKWVLEMVQSDELMAALLAGQISSADLDEAGAATKAAGELGVVSVQTKRLDVETADLRQRLSEATDKVRRLRRLCRKAEAEVRELAAQRGEGAGEAEGAR